MVERLKPQHAADFGLTMPAEWALHARCWMAWPTRGEVWGDTFAAVAADYARVAQAIARHEQVTMVANAEDVEVARAACGPTVIVATLPIDDSWMRDSGPTFLTDGRGGKAAAVFRFNAWGGKYEPHQRDAAVAGSIALREGLPVLHSDIYLEGGGILSDGEGTLITTETCLLNPNRNPGRTKAEVEAELKRVLGVITVIWLPGDETDTETDGHIDGLLAWTGPATVLFEEIADPADPRHAIMAENRRALELARDAKGRSFTLLPIAEAPRSVNGSGGDRFCRSYCNFYMANGAVVLPTYGIPEDELVTEQVRRALPDRVIEHVDTRALIAGGGGIHCITHEEPA